ncbi:myb/SANT-like DNA-binding domain-containing protein 4 [Saccostrea cucullata]|uniref:myb/SANT-like DNA-binding domain-containing protein 4 n=1 Tax=Saccostrea cuccullata TaxID=36930 RepID=UPI002ED64772
MEKERKRKPRFLDREVDVLINKVNEKSEMLFSRFSDTISNKRKKLAWTEVQNSVNASSLVPRTVDEIKKKWDDVKRITKKRAVEVRKDRSVTGGGQNEADPLTPMEEMVVSLIGEERVYGLADGMDCFELQQLQEGSEAGEVEKALQQGEIRSEGTCSSPLPDTSKLSNDTRTTPNRCSNVKDRDRRRVTADKGEKESTHSELLSIEKERLMIEKQRLKLEEDRYLLEKERLQELRKISHILQDMANKTSKGNSQTQEYMPQDYSYLYASLT